MITSANPMRRIVILASAMTLLFGVAGAQARAVRHVPQATPALSERARLTTNPAAVTPLTVEPMCEVLRMQVPTLGRGLSWATVQECTED